MKKLLAFLVLTTALLIPGLALAAQFVAPDEAGNAVLEENVAYRNLYTAGNNIRVKGNISGDLVVAGGTVNIDGQIEQNLLGAGGTVSINGPIGRNVRFAAGNMLIENSIGEDLIVGAGTIDLAKNSQVGGDLLIGGGSVNLAGTVNGNVWVSGGEVRISGQVKGNVVAKNIESLTITEGADIGGNLTYSAPNEGEISANAVQGETTFTRITASETFAKASLASTLYGLIGTILTLLVIFYLLPKWSAGTVVSSFDKYWQKLGIGFLTLFITPIAIIALIAATAGLLAPLSFLLGIFYVLALFAAGILIPLLIGYLLSLLMKKPRIDWLTIIVGAAFALIISYIPFVGPLFLFGLFLIALGEITSQILQAGKKLR